MTITVILLDFHVLTCVAKAAARVVNDEYCVYDPDLVLPIYVVDIKLLVTSAILAPESRAD